MIQAVNLTWQTLGLLKKLFKNNFSSDPEERRLEYSFIVDMYVKPTKTWFESDLDVII